MIDRLADQIFEILQTAPRIGGLLLGIAAHPIFSAIFGR
jgi:hypothetical protein